MARIIWKNRSWLRKFFQQLRSSEAGSSEHRPFPESYFLEKLTQEGKRALRSHKPLVLMIVDAANLGPPGGGGDLADSLGSGVNACLRESDICGLLGQETLIGVILTEVETEKIGSAQLVVAKKTRERLAALLSMELANRVTISFRIFPANDGRGLFDLAAAPDLITSSIAAQADCDGRQG